MTDFNVLWSDPKVSASNLGQYVVVQHDVVDNQVFVAGTSAVDCIGVSQASVPTYGMPVAVARLGKTKVLVAASLGAGCRVCVASVNGGIGPIAASGQLPSLGPSAGIFLPKFTVGHAEKAAAPGDYTTIFLNPRQVV